MTRSELLHDSIFSLVSRACFHRLVGEGVAVASRKGISESRLKTIYRRQTNPTWDGDYLPSILATPAEAPSISRAFTLTPEKLGGRETHLLSTPERNAALLGLYHPAVVGLQEQRMLSPEPTEHPLWTYPGIDRIRLPPLKGLIDVAERLGYLDILPRVRVSNPDSPDDPVTLVFPWSGDLLWAIEDGPGDIYCINWSVKSCYEDFKRPGPRRDGKPRSRESSRNAIARHEIEETYYADAEVGSIRVADEAIDEHVAANLRQLFLHHRRPLDLSDDQRLGIVHKYELAFRDGIAPAEVITSFVERRRFSVDQCRSTLFQAIWNRQLRVDLFSPILINRPLRPEMRDVVDVYANWFRRS